MQIEINGKRNITLDFNAPKKFRLVKDGAEIPYIRTGKNSFRLTKPVEGFVELEEIVEQPRYMQPVQLQPQQMTVINPQDVDRLNEAVRQMALVNPQDVMIINQTAEQLEKNQNFIAQTQKEITDNQVYIDQQQQRLNETALGIQALETDNSQRLDGAENAIFNLAGEISNAQNMAVDGMNTALNKIEEQGILLQAEIDTKADKQELETLKKDFEEKSDQFSNAMSNYSGGFAYDTLPRDGEAGQILAKRTDRQGDYIWIDQTPVIVKSETMPTASEKYKGEVYQYVGETGDYTHGYIYECQQNGTSYEWVRLDVQPNHSTEIESLTTRVGNLETGKQDKLSQTQMDAVNSGANQSNIAQITTNQTNINTINDKIPAQASSENQLTDKNYVDTADNDLQQQIDAITAASDVTDVVGTYAQLQAYDTSTLPNNSIIKVLQDESRNDETTYYRWVITAGVGAWVLIGEEGPYYTKSETNTLLSAKQPTLVSGTNIKTINGSSLLGSGNLSVAADINPYISNCITEIPQDIKLEISNSNQTIVLKKGSSYYIPDGNNFVKKTISSDYSSTLTSGLSGTYMIFAGRIGDDNIFVQKDNTFYSGATEPTFTTNIVVFYDTTNNIIKFSNNRGSSWFNSKYSFPICKFTCSNGVITEIDQVFNGFGYIGSTVFALPGVKGLIPNGINEDGTLKSTEFTVNSVLTINSGYNNSDEVYSINGTKFGVSKLYLEQEEIPSSTSTLWYKIPENEMYRVSNAGTLGKFFQTVCVRAFRDSTGKITSFTPKTAFHAVDYNDFDNLTINVLKTVYPVGSCFIGTTSTCPLEALFGTWTVVSSGIVKAGDIPVKGNGMTLGLTDGRNFGTTGISFGTSGAGAIGLMESAYGENTGITASGNFIANSQKKTIGVTTDASKSGIVADTSSLTLSVNIWQRSA